MNCRGVLFSNDVAEAIDRAVERLSPVSLFVVADENTSSLVLPRLRVESAAVAGAATVVTKAGEAFKNLDTLAYIWKCLGDGGATRNSAVINVGGGVVTDIGAFAAATFKRGIPFINVPTTLLGAVDASVGGKTGINFNSLKNEVGVFAEPEQVVISTVFFGTLSRRELLSGYAEMIKHGMLTSAGMTGRLLEYDIAACEPVSLLGMLRESVEVKLRYVHGDFTDKGMRHALNFGHTVAHAFEALALCHGTVLPHGYAVAFGMVVELVLSHLMVDFPAGELHRYADYVAGHYGAFNIECSDYPELVRSMHHDKKNSVSGVIDCTLLRGFGDAAIGVGISDADMKAALDIYRDLLHIA